jgi:hypothetical protein
MIARGIPAEGADLGGAGTRELWDLHARLSREFASVWREARDVTLKTTSLALQGG